MPERDALERIAGRDSNHQLSFMAVIQPNQLTVSGVCVVSGLAQHQEIVE